MVARGTVAVVVRCRCPRDWIAPVQVGRAMLRRLAEGGAPADLLVTTTKCKHCATVVEHRLGDLVPWREAA